MKFRKLLALALTGVTLLSTVPVQAQTTNSIGYTTFMPLDDGGNTYMMNSDHVQIGTLPDWDENSGSAVYNKITDQEIKLPKNMWVSFDVINTTFEETQERTEWDDSDYFMSYISNNFLPYSAEEYLDAGYKLPTDCLVTFKQDGKIIKQFDLDVDKRLDHVSFKFYNKSDSPVIVSTTTDNWFVGDVGYTAHKATKDITNRDWSFSFMKKKTFIATTDIGKGYSKKARIGIVTSDGKSVTATITKQGKFIAKKTIKSGTSVYFTLPKQGKYKVTINSNSDFFNIIAFGNSVVNNYKLKSQLVIPSDYKNKVSVEYLSPNSAVKGNRRYFLISSSGNGNYIHAMNNGGSYNDYELLNFNQFLESNNKADTFRVNDKVDGLKSKGNGWLYAVQQKGSKLAYDRLSW